MYSFFNYPTRHFDWEKDLPQKTKENVLALDTAKEESFDMLSTSGRNWSKIQYIVVSGPDITISNATKCREYSQILATLVYDCRNLLVLFIDTPGLCGSRLFRQLCGSTRRRSQLRILALTLGTLENFEEKAEIDLVTGALLCLKISCLDPVVPPYYERAVRRLIGASAYTLRALHLDPACSIGFLPSRTSLPSLTTLRVCEQFVQHHVFNKSPLTDLEIVCDELECTLKDDETMNTVSHRFPSLSRLSVESPNVSTLIKVEHFKYLSSVFPKLKHLAIRQNLDEISALLQEQRAEDVAVRDWMSKISLHSFTIQYAIAWNGYVCGWHYVSTEDEVERRSVGSKSGEAE